MKTAIALGTFDGIHTGHRAVIEKTDGYHSVAVTFRVPPKLIFSASPQLLMQPEERLAQLKTLGIKEVDILKFEVVERMPPEDFLESLKNKYNPSLIVCGFNYRFGFEARGNIDTLRSFCNANKIEFVCVSPVEYEGDTISSSRIRMLITEGKVEKANELMYGGFSFSAPVVQGDHRGRELGFPTINQRYPAQLVTPKFGVYASEVVLDGVCYSAITNIGVRPTYRTATVGCETFINGFSGNLYGRIIRVRLKKFIREETKFNSFEELKRAISKDIENLFGKQ